MRDYFSYLHNLLVPANLMLEGNPAMYWHPIQGEGGGRRSTPSRFMPQKLEISAGLIGS